MGIEQIKSEIAALAEEQQDHLAAYLVHLRHQRDDAVRREIAKKIDDKARQNWLTIDQLKEEWKD